MMMIFIQKVDILLLADALKSLLIRAQNVMYQILKSKYVVQYKNLQLYLSLEVKLTKVHRVLKFKQSDWLKNMLILIQKKVNSFEKDLIKLMINSVYDKTM